MQILVDDFRESKRGLVCPESCARRSPGPFISAPRVMAMPLARSGLRDNVPDRVTQGQCYKHRFSAINRLPLLSAIIRWRSISHRLSGVASRLRSSFVDSTAPGFPYPVEERLDDLLLVLQHLVASAAKDSLGMPQQPRVGTSATP